jgi:hypothetical protein
MDRNTVTPHLALVAAADNRTLRALAQYEGAEPDAARAQLEARGEPVLDISARMVGHADRIDYLLGNRPAADAIFQYATGRGQR